MALILYLVRLQPRAEVEVAGIHQLSHKAEAVVAELEHGQHLLMVALGYLGKEIKAEMQVVRLIPHLMLVLAEVEQVLRDNHLILGMAAQGLLLIFQELALRMLAVVAAAVIVVLVLAAQVVAALDLLLQACLVRPILAAGVVVEEVQVLELPVQVAPVSSSSVTPIYTPQQYPRLAPQPSQLPEDSGSTNGHLLDQSRFKHPLPCQP